MSKDLPTGQAEITLSVPGMLCDGYAERVRSTLISIDGVCDARPSTWHKRVQVFFDPAQVGSTRLTAALAEQGLEAVRV